MSSAGVWAVERINDGTVQARMPGTPGRGGGSVGAISSHLRVWLPSKEGGGVSKSSFPAVGRQLFEK